MAAKNAVGWRSHDASRLHVAIPAWRWHCGADDRVAVILTRRAHDGACGSAAPFCGGLQNSAGAVENRLTACTGAGTVRDMSRTQRDGKATDIAVGRHFRAIRESLGLSLRDVERLARSAGCIGVTFSKVAQLEKGQLRWSTAYAERLARALGISPGEVWIGATKARLDAAA